MLSQYEKDLIEKCGHAGLMLCFMDKQEASTAKKLAKLGFLQKGKIAKGKSITKGYVAFFAA